MKQLNHDLQAINALSNQSEHRPDLPLLISVDYEGGQVTRLQEQYGFPAIPSAASVGKKGFAVAEETAKTMAHTLKQAEFNLNFAPIMDLNSNPQNPVIALKERAFSSSPIKSVIMLKYTRNNFTKTVLNALTNISLVTVVRIMIRTWGLLMLATAGK